MNAAIVLGVVFIGAAVAEHYKPNAYELEALERMERRKQGLPVEYGVQYSLAKSAEPGYSLKAELAKLDAAWKTKGLVDPRPMAELYDAREVFAPLPVEEKVYLNGMFPEKKDATAQ
jgi:hypothetical protein